MTARIDHVVVLMLENRSFDHALGYLKAERPDLEGLDGTQTNPDGTGVQRCTTFDATYRDPDTDSGHEYVDVTYQLFRAPPPPPPIAPTNQGFIENFARKKAARPLDVMKCFA